MKCFTNLWEARATATVRGSGNFTLEQNLQWVWRKLLPLNQADVAGLVERKVMPAKEHWRRSELELVKVQGASTGPLAAAAHGEQLGSGWQNSRWEVRANGGAGRPFAPSLIPHDWDAGPATPVGRMEYLRGIGAVRGTDAYRAGLIDQGGVHSTALSTLESSPRGRSPDPDGTPPPRPKRQRAPAAARGFAGLEVAGGYDPGRWILSLLHNDEDDCYDYTGEPGFRSLVLSFEYFNAGGMMEKLKVHNRKVTESAGAEARVMNGRAKLTPFEQYVFTRIAYRNLRGRGRLKFAADYFGISVKHGRKLYNTLVPAIGRFFKGQQHPATRMQAKLSAPARSVAKLGIKDNEAPYVGDCTERFCDDSHDGSVHSALYSSYKHHTTGKILVVETLSLYCSHAPPTFVGAATDNATHQKAGIPQML